MRSTILAILAIAALTARAASQPSESSPVPIRWTVETSRVQPAMYDAYQGETLELEAVMQSYGKPFAISGEDVRLFWQTNGMGSAWWSAPASVKVGRSGERDTYAASWTPSMDAGAGVYSCFLGQAGGNYRAEFRLRLRPSPGAVPNTLDLPRRTIDFATVEVLNPPWSSSDSDRISDGEHRIDADGKVYEMRATSEWTFSDGRGHVVEYGDGGWTMDGYTIFNMDRESRTLSNALLVPTYMPEVVVATLAQTSRWDHVGRVALTNEMMTAEETTSSLRILNDTYPGMRVSPPASEHVLPANQFRVLVLGDEKTVAAARYLEADKILVESPRDLLFVTRRDVLPDGSTNFVLKSFQDHLSAVSPVAVNDLVGAYLPTNGGGTVTGELNVEGNMRVSGVLDAPRLLRVVTTDIEARGFTVSNGVLRSASGLVVSNGMCAVKCARAEIGFGAPRFHVEGGVGSLTFGGSWDQPDGNLDSIMDARIRNALEQGGFGSLDAGDMLKPSHGAVSSVQNGWATKADVLALAPVTATRAVEDRRASPTSGNGILMLRNNCVNVLRDVLDCPGTVHVYFPLIGEHESWDMGQRLSFGIYVPHDMSASSIVWDYPADDGGYSFRGETGDELSSLRTGDLVWFQQVGLHELAVRKTRFGNTIEVEQH